MDSGQNFPRMIDIMSDIIFHLYPEPKAFKHFLKDLGLSITVKIIPNNGITALDKVSFDKG